MNLSKSEIREIFETNPKAVNYDLIESIADAYQEDYEFCWEVWKLISSSSHDDLNGLRSRIEKYVAPKIFDAKVQGNKIISASYQGNPLSQDLCDRMFVHYVRGMIYSDAPGVRNLKYYFEQFPNESVDARVEFKSLMLITFDLTTTQTLMTFFKRLEAKNKKYQS